MTDRNRLYNSILTFIHNHKDILAAWEGGSAAFGRNDSLSDIDINLITSDKEKTVLILQEFEQYIESELGIRYLYRVPSPTWHGGEQSFILCRDVPPTLLIDVAIFYQGATNLFLEPEIHGMAIFVKDTINLKNNLPHIDVSRQKQRIVQRYNSIRGSFELFATFPEKELQRGKPIEAFSFYNAFILRPLIELLRMKYSPERFDFNTRLLYSDLPEEIVMNLEELFFCKDSDSLLQNIREAVSWCRDEIKDFEEPIL